MSSSNSLTPNKGFTAVGDEFEVELLEAHSVLMDVLEENLRMRLHELTVEIARCTSNSQEGKKNSLESTIQRYDALKRIGHLNAQAIRRVREACTRSALQSDEKNENGRGKRNRDVS